MSDIALLVVSRQHRPASKHS